MILEQSKKQKLKVPFKIALKQICHKSFWCALILDGENKVTHSGISPKASADWAAVLYALMYSLAVFWTWHSCTENVFYNFFLAVLDTFVTFSSLEINSFD